MGESYPPTTVSGKESEGSADLDIVEPYLPTPKESDAFIKHSPATTPTLLVQKVPEKNSQRKVNERKISFPPRKSRAP